MNKEKNDVDRIDSHRIMEEIHREVQRRRADGRIPPDLEHEITKAFREASPPGTASGDIPSSIEQLAEASHFDLTVPTASNLPGGSYVKRMESKVLRWYMQHINAQFSEFGSILTQILRALDNSIEKFGPLSPAKILTTISPPMPAPSPFPFSDHLIKAAQTAPGRILHAECGTGTLVRLLADAGADIYGVDPSETATLEGATARIDTRSDTALAHLDKLADNTLGGVILSGSIDSFSLPEKQVLLEMATEKTRDKGFVGILGNDPRVWERSADPLVLDLAAGKPLRATTWGLLFAQLRLTTEIHESEIDNPFANLGDDVPLSLRDTLQRFGEQMSGPRSHLVLGTK